MEKKAYYRKTGPILSLFSGLTQIGIGMLFTISLGPVGILPFINIVIPGIFEVIFVIISLEHKKIGGTLCIILGTVLLIFYGSSYYWSSLLIFIILSTLFLIGGIIGILSKDD